MKAIVCTLAIAAVMILCAVVEPVSADSKSSKGVSAHQYERIIDELICSCEKKGEMSESSSRNIRDDVAMSLMKARFYRKNREKLVEDMLRESVAPCRHSVKHFVNQQFFAIVRNHDSKVAETYSAPEEITLP